MENKEYYDRHYAEMPVQPIEVNQRLMTPEAFNGGLWWNIVKYYKRAGHKTGEAISKEEAKLDRYISWLYHALRGEKINPKNDYDYPPVFKEQVLNQIDKIYAELLAEKERA